ncbi:flagellar assembly factor FliW [Salsuginibacillus halophilus]|uniref:Flagellar assembly factor FliW n=1 Tax=Salsuginibacillus halophilus TaxID=517424 RepID=A0A2P8HQW5_9BACI|nr:flagellar assembly protein FliW [Salsuginibacillus halophilus]PSL48574.1 flagellar assembly factor FliW [Salsuginibacillus halophilus]
MHIETKYSGTVNVAPEEVYHFEHGLPAFEDEQRFVLMPFKEGTPFYILQSVETPELAFVMVNPFHFFADYQVEIPESTITQLNITQQQDAAIFSIVTIQEPFQKSTANLQGPVVLNVAERQGKQILLNDTSYGRKHHIFPQEEAAGQEGR